MLRAPGPSLFLIAGALVAALAAAGGLVPSYYQQLLTEALIMAIFAVSLDLLMGYTGLPSLGHAAFFGIAAYAAGIASLRFGVDFWPGLLIGVAMAAALAAFFGLLALRTLGVYFLMITLALAEIVWAIAFGWRSMTGGDDGLSGIHRPGLGLESLGFGSHLLAGSTAYFYFTFVLFIVTGLALLVLVRSPFGLALRGIQESEKRMAALGYNVWLYKYLAFIIAGAFAGVAGVLFVYFKGFIGPDSLDVVASAQILLMVILGGAGTLFGPVVGAFAIVFLSNVVSTYTTHWVLVLGLIYIAVVMLAPRGILGAALAPQGAAGPLS